MKNFLFEIIFPKKCIGCKKFGSFLCSLCFSNVSFHTKFICPMCLAPSVTGATHPACRTPYAIDGLLSALEYKGIVKKILYQFKYKPYISELKTVIGKLAQESFSQNETFYGLLLQKPLIIPVPLHKKKERARGYNHASLLSSYVAQYFKVEYIENCLVRIKNTRPQFSLDPTTRSKNVKNAFELNKQAKEAVKGKTVLIIDDVATTCSTLRECAKVLKRNGAGYVWGITFAKEI